MTKKDQVDITKKSNRKCKHCRYWNSIVKDMPICIKTGLKKQYYHCCKFFEWRKQILENWRKRKNE